MPMHGPKALYREDGRAVDQLPADFHSTDFFTDRIIEYIDDSQQEEDKPFLAYLAYTAPHWPLQAPDHLIDKYKGRYDAGPVALREARLSRMKTLGLIAENTQAHPFIPAEPDWENLGAEQKFEGWKFTPLWSTVLTRMLGVSLRLLRPEVSWTIR